MHKVIHCKSTLLCCSNVVPCIRRVRSKQYTGREIQVEELDEDLTVTRIDLTELEGCVNFLFDEQVIQDERILILKQENDVIDDELESEFSL